MTTLEIRAAGLRFQNPIVLAAGTAAYGRELAGVMSLDQLGGLTTKAVSLEPRHGAPSPRVAEFDGGMINAVGLANPGVSEVITEHLPWLRTELRGVRTVVNVVGFEMDEYARVVRRIEEKFAPAMQNGHVDENESAYELNLSCPNTKAGGLEFGADPRTLAGVVSRARVETKRPLFVKLSPILVDIADSARAAVDAGADGITVVNTIPGLVIDLEQRRPVLGFGTGGVSGAGLRPVGVLATWKVSRAVKVPVIGVGGVATAQDALQYLMAGASLVGVGTAALQDPRTPMRIVRDLGKWCREHDVASISDVVGTLEWPA